MRRLVWASAGRTYHIVGNLMLRLIYNHIWSAVGQFQRVRLGIERWLVQDPPESLLCLWARYFILCLVLVQLRKSIKCPNMTEKLLTSCNSHALTMSILYMLFLHENIWYTVDVLKFQMLPKMPRQTAQTPIRLLLKKQSDHSLPYLLFWPAFCDF